MFGLACLILRILVENDAICSTVEYGYENVGGGSWVFNYATTL